MAGWEGQPTPGSDEAITAGCICPVNPMLDPERVEDARERAAALDAEAAALEREARVLRTQARAQRRRWGIETAKDLTTPEIND